MTTVLSTALHERAGHVLAITARAWGVVSAARRLPFLLAV
ncbi:hypothetical protein BKP43_30790 [Variovorax boronicumulans]|nr:hypothetical protein BKP43_30790 [Variovorax boronicumulans]